MGITCYLTPPHIIKTLFLISRLLQSTLHIITILSLSFNCNMAVAEYTGQFRVISRNYIVYCLITDSYYKLDDTIALFTVPGAILE